MPVPFSFSGPRDPQILSTKLVLWVDTGPGALQSSRARSKLSERQRRQHPAPLLLVELAVEEIPSQPNQLGPAQRLSLTPRTLPTEVTRALADAAITPLPTPSSAPLPTNSRPLRTYAGPPRPPSSTPTAGKERTIGQLASNHPRCPRLTRPLRNRQPPDPRLRGLLPLRCRHR